MQSSSQDLSDQQREHISSTDDIKSVFCLILEKYVIPEKEECKQLIERLYIRYPHLLHGEQLKEKLKEINSKKKSKKKKRSTEAEITSKLKDSVLSRASVVAREDLPLPSPAENLDSSIQKLQSIVSGQQQTVQNNQLYLKIVIGIWLNYIHVALDNKAKLGTFLAHYGIVISRADQYFNMKLGKLAINFPRFMFVSLPISEVKQNLKQIENIMSRDIEFWCAP